MTDTIWIRSTAHPETGEAACLITWGSEQTLLTPEVTLVTARELTAAAAAAETDIALVQSLRQDIRADNAVIGGMLMAVRRRRPSPAARGALRIQAVAGAKTDRPYVHIARGSKGGELAPDEAREMAGHWTEAAVAAQIDARLRHTLTGHPALLPADVDQIFQQLQSLQR
ncbi:hypothetical protein ACWD64_19980 [Streptomyces antibioticus]